VKIRGVSLRTIEIFLTQLPQVGQKLRAAEARSLGVGIQGNTRIFSPLAPRPSPLAPREGDTWIFGFETAEVGRAGCRRIREPSPAPREPAKEDPMMRDVPERDAGAAQKGRTGRGGTSD